MRQKSILKIVATCPILFAAGAVFAQSAPDSGALANVADKPAAASGDSSKDDQATAAAPPSGQRVNPSSTSNTTTSNDTLRTLSTVQVTGQAVSLGGGLMSVQTAPKAVSTISREAIEKAAPGSNFTQLISTIPGANTSTDDVTGLADGNFCIRGFCSGQLGVTVNGAPVADSGNYAVYATEYGDAENFGDITVEQGIPNVDAPDSGASGGHIGWATIDPSHNFGVDLSQSLGSHDYERTFIRVNTGDTGPIRSWLSYSTNSADKWRGDGDMNVTKVDGKSIWTIDDQNSVSASFQYNREVKYLYFGLTKAQGTQNYYADYDTSYAPGSLDTNYWKLHANPFRSLMFSMDGEFTLSDNLHLSVIPYFQYGDGGSGSGSKYFQESTGTTNEYEYANQDLNGDGKIINGTKVLAYLFSASTTYRPGVLAKLNQNLGQDNSLEYGFWYEAPRQQQSQKVGIGSATGEPGDLWGQSDFINYPDGRVQMVYDEYTQTEVEKVFATDTWTPTDHWTAVLGAAYLHVKRQGYDYEYPGSEGGYNTEFGSDNVDAAFHKIMPTFGLKFAPDEQNQFYAGIGKSFRAPPNVAVALNQVVGVDPNVPESSWNTDIGWRYYGDQLSVNAMLYNSNFFNKTVAGYDQDTGETFYTEIHHVRMQGFNGETSYKLNDDWNVYGSYTFTKAKVLSDIDTKDDGFFPTAGKDQINTPRNMVNVGINYSDGPVWASAIETYHSSIYGDYMNTEKVGGYSTLGLSAGYKFADFSESFKKPYIKLNVFNAFDHHAFTNASNSSSYIASNPNHIVGVDGGSLYASAPYYTLLEPRTFMLTIGASFF